MRRVLAAAFTYFTIVFAAGFAFGVVRERFAVPMLGQRGAEVAEIPLMVGVSILAALWVTTRFFFRATLGQRLATGLLALLLLLGAEYAIVAGVRALTVEEYLESRDPVAFVAYLVGLSLFAVMPTLVTTRRG